MIAVVSRRTADQRELLLQVVLVALMVVYYGAVLTNFTYDFFHPTEFGLTFNSMLQHLLHGRFDVDPQAVGKEGFARGGRVYAYWGIFCALIRAPLLAIRGGLASDVTTLSCLVAVTLAGAFKLNAVLFLRRYTAPHPASELLFALLVAYVVLGGAQVAYLKVSIFQEVVFWAVALAAAFVFCCVRGIITDSFSTRLLLQMAALAGLALLTRVSTGLGLCLATGLLLIVLLIARPTPQQSNTGESGHSGLLQKLRSARIMLPVAVLIVFVGLAGIVNYQRWGDPAKFADYSRYVSNGLYPDRVTRTAQYGLFNFARVPFGLGYFFLPLWVLRGADGKLLFEVQQTRLLDNAELPPSSFFLTDLLPLVFAVFAGASILRLRPWRAFSRALLLSVAIGLAVPPALMLLAISMNYRYRMEFYPEIDLWAFLGFYAVTGSTPALEIILRRRWLFIVPTVVSIISAHGALLLYKASPFGPAQIYIPAGQSIDAFYLGTVQDKLQRLRSLLISR
jgi:hypothetical protein